MKIAELAASEPELLINEVEKRIQARKQVKKNQAVGASIENLIQKALEGEGFKVERTGVGSDFVIEHDFIVDDAEILLGVTKENTIQCSIEVKATSQDFAKMTLTQAEKASNESDKYALCVVELGSSDPDETMIKDAARFVTDIGERLGDKVSQIKDLQEEQQDIATEGDIEVEITQGQIRLKVNKKVWGEGRSFADFLDYLRNK